MSLRAFTALFVLCALAAPASADGVLTAPASVERVGPAAGKAKPYYAQIAGTCVDVICTADFGKKGNKVRRIDSLSCTVVGEKAAFMLGANVSASPGELLFFTGPVTTPSAGLQNSIFQWTTPFTVPAGAPFRAVTQSLGLTAVMVCSAYGTIE